LGAQVRAGFVVPEGELFGSWDLSAAEMRVMAGLSRDPLLVRMFKEKRDPHAETAARIFGIKLADVDEMKHRYPAKRAGFGVITNIKGAGLYDQLRMFGCEGWSIERCDELIREWLKVYKGVHAFLDECAAEARKKGVVYDYWGMPRHLPGVWSSNRKIAADDERAASSHLIQGGAQGMIQRSMAYAKSYIRALQQAELNVKWILQQHDSLILSFSEDLWDTVDPLIVDALTNHHDMDLGGVPMVAKGSKARTWAGLK
jgi:DNA polymerase-1